MSEFSPSTLLNLLQNSIPSKKEEMKLLDHIINNFNQDSNLPNEYSQIYNNLIENRIELIKEAEPDFLYIFKVFQAIRVLTRNKEIQKLIFNEKHINILFNVLNQLHNIQKSNNKNIKIIEAILIELITILKRFLYPDILIEKEKEIFFNIIANNSNVIIILIELIENKNVVLLKLFKYLFKKLLVSYNVEMNFCKTKSVEIMINNLNIENDSEVIENTLDIIILLLDKNDFIKLFIILDGFSNQLINLLKNYKKFSDEIITKILHINNFLFKNENNLENYIDIKIINDLYEILNETIYSNFLISKSILNIFSVFCLNNEINILLRTNFLKNFFILLLDLNTKLKENNNNNNNSNKKILISNEILTIRILRLIYSLNYNKKYFKNYFPEKILFEHFIKIGDYKSSINYYEKFIEFFNKLNLEEILHMKKNINSINTTTLINNNNNIGGFEIIEMIGKGGFGSVFKVKKNSKIFAMKIIGIEIKQFLNIKEIMNNKENLENAFSEIKIWKKLNHINFVNYYLAFIENNKCYIIMEFIDGLTLGEYINHLKETNQKISKKFMIEILIQIVSGLRYMKNNKIIYKDLNPNNILIYSKNKIKLIDFGLAIDLNSPRNNEKEKINVINQSVSPEFEGSIFYSSPEVMNNELIDYSCDIWALGCILYEMIKLKPPFNGDNPLTIAKNICDLNFDEKLSKNECDCDEIYEIIMRSLVVNPKERISIEEICKILGEFVFEKLDKENELNVNLKKENESLKKIIEKLKEKK